MKIKLFQRTNTQAPRLDYRFFLIVACGAGCILLPLLFWSGWDDPELFKILIQSWPSKWAEIATITCIAGLVLIPLIWVLVTRVLGLLALFMIQNATLLLGYFFLGTTGQHFPNIAQDIMDTGSLVIAINCLGFAILFLFLGITYFLITQCRMQLPPLRASPLSYDLQLRRVLQFTGIGVFLGLSWPMFHHGIIPLISHAPEEARVLLIQSDFDRSLFNAATTILPFVVGGLFISIIRKPTRLFGLDGILLGPLILAQLFSANRFSLAIAFFVIVTLSALEKRWPRFLVLIAFIAFPILLCGISGFTSILRAQRLDTKETNIVTQSFQEAFYGDNLIDVRDAAWVFSQWDFQPLMGETYLGGLVAALPSGYFPQKKQWHLGLTGVRIVGWDPEKHFGLRITFFGESFLNFGLAGVIGLAILLGCLFGSLLRALHLASAKRPPCLHYNLKIVILTQMGLLLSNTSDAYSFWTLLTYLAFQWLMVDLPIKWGGVRLHALPIRRKTDCVENSA